ncbi:MAG: protein phosphatase 2C domain-containing protein [Bacteroidales bacterium]|nr:protein phosphatase 2C domain-containing protein [Bacteroidales bacterium]
MELYQIKTEHPIVGYCESRIGGRTENQDSYGYHDTPFGLLVVVCDGMGGGPAGKTASSMAVSEILKGVMECEPETAPKDVLEKAIQRANLGLLDAIAENPELSGMGTTCTALLLNEHSAIMAHVGDSRIYQLRRHGKVFRTFDHSLVFDLVKQKVITEEQARLSDQSNIITRALGMKPEIEIDIEERPYNKGDRFMLCTDGIHGTMPEKELMALATQRGELGKVVDGIAAMVDGNGKKNGGGHDNLTLVIVETKEKSELKEKMKNKTTLILGIIAVVLAVIALMLNSCQNEDIDVDTFRIAQEQVLPGADTVGITGTYDFFKEAESMKINIGRDSTLADAQSHTVVLTGKDYAVTIRNLQANTKYYYNYSVNVGVHSDFITPTKSFQTSQAQNYTVSVAAIPNEGGTVSGGGTYAQGQQCTVTATANEGYTFINWMENDSVVSVDSVYRFSVTGNRNLAAQFALLISEPTVITGEITDITQTTAKGSGEVTADGGSAVTERGLCWSTSHNPTIIGNHATIGSGIGAFSVDMSNLSANTKYYVRAYATNSEGTAYGNEVDFTTSQLNNYTVSVSANPTNGGSATGGGSYQQGQSCTVRATANTGYNFVNWTEDGNQVSTNVNYTFTVNGNRTLVANFTAGS